MAAPPFAADILPDTRLEADARHAYTVCRVFLLCTALLLAGCNEQRMTAPARDTSSMRTVESWPDGSHIRAPDGQSYLVFAQTLHPVPDAATLSACTGGYPAVAHAAALPALPLGAALPSAETHAWLMGARPVRSADGAAVHVVSGCVRSPIEDAETYYALFGRGGAITPVVVPGDVLVRLPLGPAARVPLRAAGALIRTASSPEVRWVTHVGAARAVPSLDVLRSYCRTDVQEVSSEEFAAYPSLALLPAASLGCESATPPPGNGVVFRVAGESGAWLAFDGAQYRFPDAATLSTCTAGYERLAQTLTARPPLIAGPTLPSAAVHGWLDGVRPIRREGTPEIYALVGCVKSPIADEAALQRLYGQEGIDDVQTVSDALLDALPTGPVASFPLRPYGTLLRGPGAEIRFVIYHGGALAVPTRAVLDSHCRDDHVNVGAPVFERYSAYGVLPASTDGCSPAPDMPTGFMFHRQEVHWRGPLFAVRRVRPDGTDGLVITPVLNAFDELRGLAASRDGRVAFSGTRQISPLEAIYSLNIDSTGFRQLTSRATRNYHPAWSPDGTRIAYSHGNPPHGLQLWIMNDDGTGARAVHPFAESSGYPSWTPAGEIVYLAFRNGSSDIVRIDPDRPSDTYELITDTPGLEEGPPAVAPDGSAIAYWARPERAGDAQLYVRHANGDVRLLYRKRVQTLSRVTWSPDSRFLAFDSYFVGGVAILNVETGWMAGIVSGVSEIGWSP